MDKIRTRHLFVAFGVVTVICVFQYTVFRNLSEGGPTDESRIASALLFDTSNIGGRIKYVKQETTHFTGFVMQNEPQKFYSALLHFTGEDRGKIFRWVAEPGDSLVKHPYSDTLILFKKNKTYYAQCYRNIKKD